MKRRTAVWGLGIALVAVYAVTAARVAVTEEAADPVGKKCFIEYKCNSCHALQAAGIEKGKAEATEEKSTSKRKPPDLSGAGKKRTAAWIEKFLLKKEVIDGERHQKKFRGTAAELKALSTWLETFKTEVKKEKKS